MDGVNFLKVWVSSSSLAITGLVMKLLDVALQSAFC